MNTNVIDNEATEFNPADREETVYNDTTAPGDNQEEQQSEETEETPAPETAPKGGTWKKAAAGAAGGVLIGGVATMLMGMGKADQTAEKPEEETDGGDTNGGDNTNTLSNPHWTDGEVPVASSPDDAMSFDQAFAAARAEVGPGGCFEWRGSLYGTYTADEWNHMTPGQRADYNSHFSWNNIDSSASDVAHSGHSSSQSHHAPASHAATPGDGEVEVIGADATGHNTEGTPAPAGQEIQAEVVEPQIEVVGVVHDGQTGANVGALNVNGEEVLVIDIDDDQRFDVLVHDDNHDDQITPDEMHDITGQGLTVQDLGGFTVAPDDMLAANDGPDYTLEPGI